MASFGETLKNYRLQAGVTQKEVADALKTYTVCIDAAEKGNIPTFIPDKERLLPLKELLSISDEDIATLLSLYHDGFGAENERIRLERQTPRGASVGDRTIKTDTYGNYIRSLRQRAKITMENAAIFIGTTKQYMYLVEKGMRGAFDTDRTEKLADLYKISAEERDLLLDLQDKFRIAD